MFDEKEKFIQGIKRIIGRRWYHQRFDGAPLYICMVAEGELKKEKRKPAGTEADIRVSYFTKEGVSDWYLDMADIRRGSRKIIKLAECDRDVGTKLLRSWRIDEKRALDFFERHKHRDFSKCSDVRLLSLYKEYHRVFSRRFSSSSIIDHFALGTDQHIMAMTREEVGRIKKESEFTDIFSIVTAPVSQSFINKAEMDLLKIAFTSPTNRRAISRYQKKYFWIKNNYFDAKILSEEDIKSEIDNWLLSGADLRAKYLQLKNTPRLNARRKADLFKRFKFSTPLRMLLKISEDFIWWQDERNKATFLSIHVGSGIMKEMAKRRRINPVLTRYLTPRKVEEWFKNGVPTQSELAARREKCVVVAERNYYTVWSGAEAERARELMFKNKKSDTVRDIRGISASVGRVTGRVTVVGSATEIGKVENGDILVAVMTRPDYIIGMKKAAGIVTDEGGITCHAAIVSRELGIPCIIGTKIATEVLRDGDIVEVNANHGVVTTIAVGPV